MSNKTVVKAHGHFVTITPDTVTTETTTHGTGVYISPFSRVGYVAGLKRSVKALKELDEMQEVARLLHAFGGCGSAYEFDNRHRDVRYTIHLLEGLLETLDVNGDDNT